MSEEIKETPTGELEQGEFKIKKKPKKLVNTSTKDIKLDLSKKPEKTEDAIQTQETNDSDVVVEEKKDEASSEKVVEEVRSAEEVKEETSIIEEITEEVKEEVVKEKIIEQTPQISLPENVEKLVSFMKETGGTVEDYVNLNKDYSDYDEKSLLNEYYKKIKPHLNTEEIDFLMEDTFSYDEEADDERTVKKRQLLFKEEIAKAKNFLESSKSKYYEEIKLRPGVTQEQQKAMEFFNRYNKEQQIAAERRESFRNKTNEIFADDFKGFEISVGEKNFRYNVSNPQALAEKQSDLNTFVKKFLNKDGEVVDTVGYHKAIYAAENVDTIANHFYEQGKADAVKDVMAKSKNITNEPRPQATGDIFINGLKVKAIDGVDSSKLKFKSKNNNN
tara:strand:- start:249 stop:1415 length:1167 start_codon:yes stop_codon:yes gene_type:complete